MGGRTTKFDKRNIHSNWHALALTQTDFFQEAYMNSNWITKSQRPFCRLWEEKQTSPPT